MYTTLDPDQQLHSGTKAKSGRVKFRSISSGETIFINYISHVSQTVSHKRTLRYLNDSGNTNYHSLSFSMTGDALYATSETNNKGPVFEKWMF